MTATPPTSSLKVTTLEGLFALLSRFWQIGSYAEQVLRGAIEALPEANEILKMQVIPDADPSESPTSPVHALFFGLEENFWGNNPGRKSVVCCHEPIGGYVIVYDSYTEDSRQGSLQVLELSAKSAIANTVFAQVTTDRFFR